MKTTKESRRLPLKLSNRARIACARLCFNTFGFYAQEWGIPIFNESRSSYMRKLVNESIETRARICKSKYWMKYGQICFRANKDPNGVESALIHHLCDSDSGASSKVVARRLLRRMKSTAYEALDDSLKFSSLHVNALVKARRQRKWKLACRCDIKGAIFLAGTPIEISKLGVPYITLQDGARIYVKWEQVRRVRNENN